MNDHTDHDADHEWDKAVQAIPVEIVDRPEWAADRATDEGMPEPHASTPSCSGRHPEPYFERPNWPETSGWVRIGTFKTDHTEPDPAHDMAALEAVERLKVKKDPDFARHIVDTDYHQGETPHEGRRRVSERLRKWWHQS